MTTNARGSLMLDQWLDGPITPPTQAEVRAAQLYVCEKAADTTDARLLLESLGLLRNAA